MAGQMIPWSSYVDGDAVLPLCRQELAQAGRHLVVLRNQRLSQKKHTISTIVSPCRLVSCLPYIVGCIFVSRAPVVMF